MNVLDEIRVYCEEKNTFGALLLTGEWGCGKTYLIKHEFCNSANYKSGFAFIVISLFGVDSTDNLHRQIKREYLSLHNPQKSKKAAKTFQEAKQVASILSDLYPGGKMVESIFSIDPIDYVEVKPKLASKTAFSFSTILNAVKRFPCQTYLDALTSIVRIKA